MARDRYRILEPGAPHFVTCTVVQWLPLFAQPANVQILLDCLRYQREAHGLLLYGYVIMENHCHLVVQAPELSKVLAGLKSFTARRMIERMRERRSPALDLLAWHKLRHKRDREHQVWQEGSHPEMIQGEDMMRQKLEYIHGNPVKRGYVDDPLHWRYSSARNYAGEEGLIEVVTRW